MANLGDDTTPVKGENFSLPAGAQIDEDGGELVVRDTSGEIILRRDETAGNWNFEGGELRNIGSAHTEEVEIERFDSGWDWILYRRDDTYYAQQGDSGKPAYSNASFSTLFHEVQDKEFSRGVHVRLGTSQIPGDQTFDSTDGEFQRRRIIVDDTVVMTTEMTISGGGNRGTLVEPGDIGTTPDDVMFQVGESAGDNLPIVRFHDLRLAGQLGGTAYAAIRNVQGEEFIIRNCELRNFENSNLILEDGTIYSSVINCWSLSTPRGIVFSGAEGNSFGEFNIYGGFHNSDQAIVLDHGADVSNLNLNGFRSNGASHLVRVLDADLHECNISGLTSDGSVTFASVGAFVGELNISSSIFNGKLIRYDDGVIEGLNIGGVIAGKDWTTSAAIGSQSDPLSCDDVTVNNCTFYGSAASITPGNSLTFVNNTIKGDTDEDEYAIFWQGTNPDYVITGNVLSTDGEALYGFRLRDADTVTFRDNKIQNAENLTSSAVEWDGVAEADRTVAGNKNYKTENSGTATINSGSTSVTVTHDLDETPSVADITVTAAGDLGSATYLYVSNVGSSSFDINVDADPSTSVEFAWRADIY